MAGISGREDAIKHINASFDRFSDLFRIPHAHQIARLVFWEEGNGRIKSFKHIFNRFAYGQTTQSITIKTDINKLFGAYGAELGVCAALDNGKEKRL